MQSTLVAGETLNYLATVPDYPASDGWGLRLVLNPRAGGSVLTVNSAAQGDDHLLAVGASTTATWSAGQYGWEIWAIKGAEQYRIEAGQLQVQASLLAAAAGLDTRSDAQKALDYLRAAWLAYTSSGNFTVGSYTINGRSVTYRSVAELRSAIAAAERDVANEQTAANIAAGLGSRKRFVVRM